MRCADQPRTSFDDMDDRCCPFDGHLRHLGKFRDERVPSRISRCVQKCAKKDQDHQLPEFQPTWEVQQWDQGGRYTACNVRDDAGAFVTQPVDQSPAEKTGEHNRLYGEETRYAGAGGAACSLKDKPPDRNSR